MTVVFSSHNFSTDMMTSAPNGFSEGHFVKSSLETSAPKIATSKSKKSESKKFAKKTLKKMTRTAIKAQQKQDAPSRVTTTLGHYNIVEGELDSKNRPIEGQQYVLENQHEKFWGTLTKNGHWKSGSYLRKQGDRLIEGDWQGTKAPKGIMKVYHFNEKVHSYLLDYKGTLNSDLNYHGYGSMIKRHTKNGEVIQKQAVYGQFKNGKPDIKTDFFVSIAKKGNKAPEMYYGRINKHRQLHGKGVQVKYGKNIAFDGTFKNGKRLNGKLIKPTGQFKYFDAKKNQEKGWIPQDLENVEEVADQLGEMFENKRLFHLPMTQYRNAQGKIHNEEPVFFDLHPAVTEYEGVNYFSLGPNSLRDGQPNGLVLGYTESQVIFANYKNGNPASDTDAMIIYRDATEIFEQLGELRGFDPKNPTTAPVYIGRVDKNGKPHGKGKFCGGPFKFDGKMDHGRFKKGLVDISGKYSNVEFDQDTDSMTLIPSLNTQKLEKTDRELKDFCHAAYQLADHYDL